jgi:hypothetical protein
MAGNWQHHKRVLLELLQATDDSKAHTKAAKDNAKPFVSDTSLKAMRVILNSAIQLVEFLLEKCNFTFVLTGKFNKDCIEMLEYFFQSSMINLNVHNCYFFRFFGIVRSCGDRMPQQPPLFFESAVCY